ncbi:MAG: phosphopyruvate hydratase [Ruminococcus sp.]|nr:phosphopyruvate hydratase [Ruminococcus sp.]
MPGVRIEKICGFEVLDSRGNPTVRAEVMLSDGTIAGASVPSGASTGIFEASELRDGNDRYNGKGVLKAVGNINKVIAPLLKGQNPADIQRIDEMMICADGTANKSKLGANAILAVSLACAKASAKHYRLPLYRFIGGANAVRLPVPMMNILNGGAHAKNNIDIQEFMIMPVGACCFREALRMGSEIYHALGKVLSEKNLSTAVGDEGGYAPDLSSDEEAIEVIITAIERAGYNTEKVRIALDVASSEWYDNGIYRLPKRKINMTANELISYWSDLAQKYPIVSLEDPLGEEDYNGWSELTEKLGGKLQLVGDDLFVTNPAYIRKGIDLKAGNAVLIKYNQIGTLSEALEAIRLSANNGYRTIVSHRSGETEETAIADIAVAVNAGQIKTGAPCRSDRTAKYNRLLRIEADITKPQYFFG